jgi:opacity protein-like surface antigen
VVRAVDHPRGDQPASVGSCAPLALTSDHEENELDRFKSLRLPFLCSAALVVAVVMLFGSAVGAAAANSTGSQSGTLTRAQGPVKTITVPLTLDCVHLSADARKYATAHNLCTGAAGTNDVSPGDCGTSQIFVYNAYNDNAQFDWGFDSSQGTVIGYGLTISYQINGGGASFDDSNAGPWSSGYRNSQTRWTGAGYLTTQLTGTVLLWWGATCGVGGASDWDWITG